MAAPDADQVTWEYNANLGRFTNFVNLLDMAGIAVPSGLLSGGCNCAACHEVAQQPQHISCERHDHLLT